MGRLRITADIPHSETSRVPLDEAVAGFTASLRTCGYQGNVLVTWEGDVAYTASTPTDAGKTRGRPEAVYAGTVFTPEFEHKGGGYYKIIVNGEVVDVVKGRAAAERWVVLWEESYT